MYRDSSQNQLEKKRSELILIDRLDIIEKQYNSISEQLQNVEVTSNIKKMTELMKKLRSIEEVVILYRKYKDIVKEIADLKELLSDSDMKELAEAELPSLIEEEKNIEAKLDLINSKGP